jgi:hypothetical protein
MLAGQIEIQLLASVARLQKDMDDAKRAVGGAMGAIEKSVETAKAAFVGLAAGLAAGVSVAAFTSMVKGAIDAADNLNDLSKRTGIAVSDLGGLGFAATQAGGNLESIAIAAGKLNKSISEAAGGNEKTAEAFDVLGISVLDAFGNLKKADKAIAEIADQFLKFEDGPEKAAIAIRLFGKEGASMIPLLNEGGDAIRANAEYYKKYAGVTQEVASQSDQFNDTMSKLNLLSGAFGRNLAAALLPPLQTLAEYLVTAKEKGDGMKTTAEQLAESLKLVAKGAVIGGTGILEFTEWVAASAAAWQFVLQGDAKGATAIKDSYEERIKEIVKGRKDMLAALSAPLKPVAGAFEDGFQGALWWQRACTAPGLGRRE